MAAGWPVEAAENRHERRFAGARRPHDGDEFAALDGQADRRGALHFDVADGESPRDVFDPEDRLAAFCRVRLDRPSADGSCSRGAGAVILADDDLVAFMQIALDDFREVVVVESDDDIDRDRPTVAQNPQASRRRA